MTDKNKNENRKEYLCIGLLAHVDAGKTTLSEAILHRTGAIRSAGRVDHGDAFLDTNSMERSPQAGQGQEPEQPVPRPMRQSACGHWWIHRDMWIFPRRWNACFRCWTMRS